jgi:hypothetical protein
LFRISPVHVGTLLDENLKSEEAYIVGSTQTEQIKEAPNKQELSLCQFASLDPHLFCFLHIIKVFAFAGFQLHTSRRHSNGTASSKWKTGEQTQIKSRDNCPKRGTATQRLENGSL